MPRVLCCVLLVAFCAPAGAADKPVPLFDGKTLAGWEGDTEKTWKVEDGAIVALDGKVSIDGNSEFRHPEHDQYVDHSKTDRRRGPASLPLSQRSKPRSEGQDR